MTKFRKILLYGIGIVSLLVLILIVISKIIFSPTPDRLRNNIVNGIKLDVVLFDERKPIVRTFELEKYRELSFEKKEKIDEKVAGKIEGDIPCVKLIIDPMIYFKFYNGKEIIKNIDNVKILLTTFPSYSSDGEKKEISERLIPKDGEYCYRMERIHDQYEKYFLEYSNVKLFYEIDGMKYISIFGIFTDNALKGTDFFENEMLEKPIPPER